MMVVPIVVEKFVTNGHLRIIVSEYFIRRTLESVLHETGGLDHATGKYVVFVDPDDWILPDYCLGLYNLQAAYSGRGLVIQGMLCRRTDGTSLPSLSLPDRYLPFSMY